MILEKLSPVGGVSGESGKVTGVCHLSLKLTSPETFGLSFMALGKVEGSHFQQEPIYTVFLFGESSCSLRKSPGSAWLPHLLKTFCSSKFPIT